MRLTVPAPVLDTHTLPAPAATSVGPMPTGMRCTTSLVAASTRAIELSRLSATHTSPAATATPVGPWPTCTVCVTTSRRGSTRSNASSS
jgi:hypothetical protein